MLEPGLDTSANPPNQLSSESQIASHPSPLKRRDLLNHLADYLHLSDWSDGGFNEHFWEGIFPEGLKDTLYRRQGFAIGLFSALALTGLSFTSAPKPLLSLAQRDPQTEGEKKLYFLQDTLRGGNEVGEVNSRRENIAQLRCGPSLCDYYNTGYWRSIRQVRPLSGPTLAYPLDESAIFVLSQFGHYPNDPKLPEELLVENAHALIFESGDWNIYTAVKTAENSGEYQVVLDEDTTDHLKQVHGSVPFNASNLAPTPEPGELEIAGIDHQHSFADYYKFEVVSRMASTPTARPTATTNLPPYRSSDACDFDLLGCLFFGAMCQVALKTTDVPPWDGILCGSAAASCSGQLKDCGYMRWNNTPTPPIIIITVVLETPTPTEVPTEEPTEEPTATPIPSLPEDQA